MGDDAVKEWLLQEYIHARLNIIVVPDQALIGCRRIETIRTKQEGENSKSKQAELSYYQVLPWIVVCSKKQAYM